LPTLRPLLSSPLMFLPCFIYSNPREVPGRRCFGFLVIPGLQEIANMERGNIPSHEVRGVYWLPGNQSRVKPTQLRVSYLCFSHSPQNPFAHP
jgi:hypothetical protein